MIKKITYLGIILSFFQIPGNLYIHLFLSAILYLLFVLNINEINNSSKTNTDYITLLIIWLLISIFSYIWVKDYNGWLKGCAVLFIALSYSISIHLSIENRKFQKTIINIIIFSAALHNVVGWFEKITRIYLFNKNELMIMQAKMHNNPLSFFDNTNDFAFFLMFIFVIIYYINMKKYIKTPLMISTFFLIIFTDSRAMYISLCISIITILYLKIKNIKLKFIFISFVFITSIFFIFYMYKMNLLLFDSDNISNNVRMNAIKNGFEFLKMSNYKGIGVGNLPYYFRNYSIYPVYGHIQMHNWWMEILTSYGIIFFIYYIIFYIKKIVTSLKLNRTKTIQFVITWLIAFVFSSISSSTIFPRIWVWIVMAISYEVINLEYRRK